MGAPLKWFPFDIDAWDTDETVRRMSYAERGVYITLLAWQWREGSVPSDAKSVAKALGASRRLVAHVLERAFISDETDGQRVVNRKLAQVYADQLARSEKASVAGRASADKRLTGPLGRSRRRIRSEIKKSLGLPTELEHGNGEATA